MKQSRLMSLAESFTNVAIGYGVAVMTQIVGDFGYMLLNPRIRFQ